MKKQWTRRGALGLMAVGAGLLAWDSSGFTAIETDRNASADIVADDVAVLGLTGTDSNGTRLLSADPFESGFTVAFTNQTAGTFTTDSLDIGLGGNVTGADGGGDVTLAESGGTFQNQSPLAPTETAVLEITNDTSSNETATISADGTTDTGTRVQLSRQVTVEPEPAFFDVIINDFDDPIAEGADMTVDVTVQNTGGLSDTQTIQLNVDANQNGNFDISADSTQITLDSGNSTSFSLTYTVQDGDDPALDFEVTSDDDSEERTTTVENGIVAEQATNMVPNVDQQQQSFEFTLETTLPQSETITITLEDAPQDATVLDYNNQGLVDDQGEGGSITLDENVGPGNDDLRFTYADGEEIPAGTDVTLRVPQVDLGSESAQSDPYDYIFRRSDTERELIFPVEISRDKGDPELTNVSATDLDATGPQTQQISFTPTTDMDPIEGVGELVAIDLSDAVDAYTNASIDTVQNASEDAFTVDTSSGEAFIRVDAGAGGVTAGTQVTVELSGVEAPSTGQSYEIGFSRGAADTTKETVTIDKTGLGGIDITNIVPHADGQQQSFEFTLTEPLPAAEAVTLTLPKSESPDSDGILDYNDTGRVDDGGAGGSIALSTNGTVVFEYAGGDQIPAGTAVELRVPNIDVGLIAEHDNPYNWDVTRTDFAGSTTTPAYVERNRGSPKLTNVSVTDLNGTNQQTQEFSFTPTTAMGTVDGLKETVAIDMTDFESIYSNGIDSGVANTGSVAFNENNNQTWLLYTPPDGGLAAGTDVTITLDGAEPDSADLDTTYEVGFSRGSADTTTSTFTAQSTLTGAEVTDIVPNANSQQQTFEFTLTEQLPKNDDVTITVQLPAGISESDFSYDEAIVDDGGQGEISFSSDDNPTIVYANESTVAAGTTVTIRATDLTVGQETAQQDPYTVTFERSDDNATHTRTFDVSRDTGTPELTSVSVENPVGTSTQTQDISFTPTTDMTPLDEEDEQLAIDLSDATEVYNDLSATADPGKATVSKDDDNGQLWVTYTADGGVSQGTDVTVTLDTVVPPQPGKSYDIGFSRGAADTVKESFSVEYVTFFDVSIVSTNAPVEEGETLTVDATITNTGAMSGTQTIRLEDTGFSNSQQDTTDETLGPGQSRTVTLEWPTSSGDAGSGDVTVESDDDSDATQVTVDTPAPTISSFSATNPSGQDIVVSFDSDEQLSTISVSLTGPESATLTEADFSETNNGGSYTYQGTYSASTTGDYTATLDTAVDADGNDGASGQSDTVTVGGILDQNGTIVYQGLEAVAGDGGETESLAPSGVDALGPPGRDLTGDGLTNLPFIENGDLKIVDSNGNQQTLVSSGHSSNPETSKTLMAVGEWNGSPPSVFYVNENNDTIYRVDNSGSPTVVATPDDGAQAVTGVGDIDGDGTEELLFADASQQLRYLEPNGTVKNLSGGQAGSNNGIGVGQPPDFDGDGVVREVLVNGGNQVKIVGEAESTITFTSTNAKKAPVTAADVDDDGSPEPVYVGSNGYIKYVDDPLGSATIKTLNDANGNKVAADGELGVVATQE